MQGIDLKFAATDRGTGFRRHVAPQDQKVALCGVAVVPPGAVAIDFALGVFDGSTCARCRNAVLKAEDDCIYIGCGESAVEMYLLSRYYLRNPKLTTPVAVNNWRTKVVAGVTA